MSSNDQEARIRERALAIWQREGRPSGGDQYYRHKARMEIEKEDMRTANQGLQQSSQRPVRAMTR